MKSGFVFFSSWMDEMKVTSAVSQKRLHFFKLCFKIFFVTQILCFALGLFAISAENQKEELGKRAKAQPKKDSSQYSFRPLLIQGKKRVIQKTKDMKLESGRIVESQLFFVDIDFQKRIFENEAVIQ